MTFADDGSLRGDIFDDCPVISIDELCRLCAADRSSIVDLVDEGVLSVVEIRSTEWRFSGATVRRARTALRLQRDLEINVPGVALALELLEELEQLRGQLQGGRR